MQGPHHGPHRGPSGDGHIPGKMSLVISPVFTPQGSESTCKVYNKIWPGSKTAQNSYRSRESSYFSMWVTFFYQS